MSVELPPQSFAEFDNFEAYFKKWIQPCLLGDLRMLLEATKYFREKYKGHPPPKYGGGNFMLFGNLMVATEHIGYFLRGNPLFFAKSSQNIGYLLSLKGFATGKYFQISAIVGLWGRNAVIHTAWPLSKVRPKNCNYYFGLGISTRIDGTRHLVLEQYKIKEFPFYKLYLNVFQYFKDLDDFCFHKIDPSKYEENFQQLKKKTIIEIGEFEKVPDKMREKMFNQITDLVIRDTRCIQFERKF